MRASRDSFAGGESHLKLCIKGEDPYEYNHTAEIELGGVRRRGNRCSLLACGN
jgi:hypothetical protein